MQITTFYSRGLYEKTVVVRQPAPQAKLLSGRLCAERVAPIAQATNANDRFSVSFSAE
jgi:hypothetical protein